MCLCTSMPLMIINVWIFAPIKLLMVKITPTTGDMQMQQQPLIMKTQMSGWLKSICHLHFYLASPESKQTCQTVNFFLTGTGVHNSKLLLPGSVQRCSNAGSTSPAALQSPNYNPPHSNSFLPDLHLKQLRDINYAPLYKRSSIVTPPDPSQAVTSCLFLVFVFETGLKLL